MGLSKIIKTISANSLKYSIYNLTHTTTSVLIQYSVFYPRIDQLQPAFLKAL